jgi:predicted transposase/invertase (TIGR01784 family)
MNISGSPAFAKPPARYRQAVKAWCEGQHSTNFLLKMITILFFTLFLPRFCFNDYYSIIQLTMARYLNPTADLTFKRIFAEHPHLLINFLNSVMPFENGRYITDIEYLHPEMVPDNPGKKFSIVDVRCKDNFKRHFIVEMQGSWYEAFMKRIVFNAGKAYVRQLNKSEDYHLLQPVYTLSILTKNFDHKTDKFYHHFQIVNRENADEIIPCLEFVLVELTEKFRPETISDRKMMVLWLRFLKEIDENTYELPAEMQENEYIREAAEICEYGKYTPEELARYDGFWDSVRIEKTIATSAKIEGRTEEKNEIALKLLKNGVSIDIISNATGLSIQQIGEIQKILRG